MPLLVPASTAGGYLDGFPDPADGPTLLCFHHAGGGASAFAGWRTALAGLTAVAPVQLPGREARAGESRFRDIAALVDDLDAALDPLLDGDVVCYGHSMGALVAYALLCRRAAIGRPLPRALLVGGYPDPHHNPPLEAAHRAPDDHLLQLMVGIGGLSETVLRYPRWARAAAAVFRDDLAVCHSFDPAGVEPLPVPVHAFTGRDDPLVTARDAAAWGRRTSVGATVRVVPGGHFFLREPGFPALLAEQLADLSTTPGRPTR